MVVSSCTGIVGYILAIQIADMQIHSASIRIFCAYDFTNDTSLFKIKANANIRRFGVILTANSGATLHFVAD